MADYGMVSIVMPAYNVHDFIEQSMRSVQSQTYTNWELIIIDDCSEDGTIEIVNKLKKNDERIHLYINEVNKGAAVSRNMALQHAQGKWVAFLDADDLWMPEKLERQLKFMVNNNYMFTYHEYSEIAENGDDIGIYVSGLKKVNKIDMYACCWPGCLTVMYDREKTGLIQVGDVRRNNDTAVWLKIIKMAPCYLLKDNLAKYRRRKGSITPRGVLKRLWAHYPLYRVSENMNPFLATFWTLMNLFGNTYKKLFYVKNIH